MKVKSQKKRCEVKECRYHDESYLGSCVKHDKYYPFDLCCLHQKTKQKRGDGMEVTIVVSEREADTAARLGLTSWIKLTKEEKDEFNSLLRSLGTAAVMKILYK